MRGFLGGGRMLRVGVLSGVCYSKIHVTGASGFGE